MAENSASCVSAHWFAAKAGGQKRPVGRLRSFSRGRVGRGAFHIAKARGSRLPAPANSPVCSEQRLFRRPAPARRSSRRVEWMLERTAVLSSAPKDSFDSPNHGSVKRRISTASGGEKGRRMLFASRHLAMFLAQSVGMPNPGRRDGPVRLRPGRTGACDR